MTRQSPQGNQISIKVTNKSEGICRTGIPFPKGSVSSLNQLKLIQNDVPVECFARPLCHWLDGSIKWANIGFYHSAASPPSYTLEINNSPEAYPDTAATKLYFESNEKTLTLTTPDLLFTLKLDTLGLSIRNHEEKQLAQIKSLSGNLTLTERNAGTAKIEHWETRSYQNLNNGSDDLIELELKGVFTHTTDKLQLRFFTTIEFYRFSPSIKVRTTIQNPNAAKHPGGIWDLGDEGSELLDALSVELTLAENDRISYQTQPTESWLQSEAKTTITQFASGGPNWQSPVHVDKNNQVPLTTNGFEVSSDGDVTNRGDRATPTIHSANGISVTIEQFWQNFPSAMKIEGNKIHLGLFPAISGVPYELQGGEQKTHTFWLNIGDQADYLNWVHQPPIVLPDGKWFANSATVPTFTTDTSNDPIKELIQTGLEHPKNFFAKREAIDEYGWRNFGELYADHETWKHTGDDLFPSHYNNQYDPIYGFLRQFLLSGDPRWYELADDLAKHVKDIDIYHTEEDRPEYNGGLFWHTDHYLRAYTATHRTFSKYQEADLEEDEQLNGGGPGGQHGYAQGLALHYLLTGDESSKQAVLGLADWIVRIYDGSNTCLELLLSAKKRHVRGIKDHISGQYPLDRGTGNMVLILLDSYQITQDPIYLHKVEHIIRNTVHPADDIEARDLTDIEGCWYYIVFLQAICRYLDIKEESGALDNEFYYARDSLLHYADWMTANEYPYLEKPERLEFVNDTWAAQDPRKTHVLYAAYYYSPTKTQAYLDKANHIQEYVVKALSESEQLSYTRIQVLLMQNHGPIKYYTSKKKCSEFSERAADWPAANYQQMSGLALSLSKALIKRLFKLSIRNEIRWLRIRLGK